VVAGTRLFVEGGADNEDEVFEHLNRIGSPTSPIGISRTYSCDRVVNI